MRISNNTATLLGQLERLREKGVQLWAESGRLRFKAPAGTLTEHDIQVLKGSRSQVIAILQGVGGQEHSEANFSALAPTQAPLSLSQLWRWHLFHLNERHSARMVARAIRLSGYLNLDVIRRSIGELIEAHQALRTRIVALDGTPTQIVIPPTLSGPTVENVRDIPVNSSEATVRELIEGCTRAPIDMSAMSLVDIRLLRLGEDEHVLVLALDHMISDAHSVEILVRDLFDGYARLLSGQAWRNGPAPTRFTDYAAWQRSAQKSLVDRHSAYWEGRLIGWQRARFPIDKLLQHGSQGWGYVSFHIEAALKKSLIDWSRRNRTTLSMCFLTVYVGLLSRWCGTSEVLVQCQTHGRPGSGLENTVGYFASLIGLRVSVRGDDCLVGLLGRVTQEYCQATDRGDSSYIARQIACGEFVRTSIFHWVPRKFEMELSAIADPSSSLTLHPVSFENVALGDLAWDNDPEIQLLERNEDIVGQVYFPRDRFAAGTIRSLVGGFLIFAESLLQFPDTPVNKLALPVEATG